MLVNQVIEYMVAYLLSGSVDPSVTKGLSIEGTKSLNFNTALKIRFLLDKDVKTFLREIETYLRKVRTEVTRERDSAKGEIRGHVDWKSTIQSWAASGFRDKTSLIVSKPVRDYDIPENLIFKKTVSLLLDLMNDKGVKKEIEQNYNWSQELQESKGHIRLVLKNVHFRKIMDAREIQVTTRIKIQVENDHVVSYTERVVRF